MEEMDGKMESDILLDLLCLLT